MGNDEHQQNNNSNSNTQYHDNVEQTIANLQNHLDLSGQEIENALNRAVNNQNDQTANSNNNNYRNRSAYQVLEAIFGRGNESDLPDDNFEEEDSENYNSGDFYSADDTDTSTSS